MGSQHRQNWYLLYPLTFFRLFGIYSHSFLIFFFLFLLFSSLSKILFYCIQQLSFFYFLSPFSSLLFYTYTKIYQSPFSSSDIHIVHNNKAAFILKKCPNHHLLENNNKHLISVSK